MSPEHKNSSSPLLSSRVTVIPLISLMFSAANYLHYGDFPLEFSNYMFMRTDFLTKPYTHFSHELTFSFSFIIVYVLINFEFPLHSLAS